MTKFDLASHITNKYPDEISPMKLQKLVYYSYVWQLVIDQKFFDAKFEAWKYGPVDNDIYQSYKHFGRQPIPAQSVVCDNQIPAELDFIIDSYAVFSAEELSKTTHTEKPWKLCEKDNAVIPDDIVIAFYQKQPFKKNFPLGSSSVYYPPKTSSHYAYTFDMEKNYVPVFDDIEDFKRSFSKAKLMLQDMLNDVSKN